MTQSRKQKRIVSIVARKGAIALAPYLDEEIGAESITANTRRIYIWLVNQADAEVVRLTEAGVFAENDSISIKYQAALNDVPPYLAVRQSGHKITVDIALALAEQLYGISDALETIDTLPKTDDKAFEDAARIKAEENGMPYPPEDPDEADNTPAADPIETADAQAGPDADDSYDGYNRMAEERYDRIAEERGMLIKRIIEAGKILGQGTRAEIDQAITNAETTYPGKNSLNQLSIEELHVLINSMDTAILSRDAAKS